ncbi:MAG: prepilin-type N-terminal cleavage/methylation domain-containing protein [Bacilli bacterium]
MRRKKEKGFTLIELLAVIVVLAIILIIAVPAIGNIIQNSRENIYQNQKGIIENSTRLYVGKNTSVLPNEIGETSEVTLNELVEKKFLEKIPKDPRTGELLPGTSVVVITKIKNARYTYEYQDGEVEPLLVTKFQSNVGSEGTYELKNVGTSNEASFFVGPNPNNWIEFGEEDGVSILWRIIKIDEEGIKIIYEGKKDESNPPEEDGIIGSYAWDESGGDWGSNKWETTTRDADLKEILAGWYEDEGLSIDTNYINPIKWCLGGVGQNQSYPTEQVTTSDFLSTECIDGTYYGEIFKGKTGVATGYGLIRASDYLSASNHENCVGSYWNPLNPEDNFNDNGSHCGRITDEAGRTNYLWKSAYNWWTFTAFGSSTSYVWRVRDSGFVYAQNAYNTSIGVRPVLNLKSDVLYNDGSGTLAIPYTVQ